VTGKNKMAMGVVTIAPGNGYHRHNQEGAEEIICVIDEEDQHCVETRSAAKGGQRFRTGCVSAVHREFRSLP
jgi:uncharacterized RmlC-like cupin family protein